MKESAFTASERKSVISLAAVLALRLVGLFMILPVLALHADDYTGSTPVLIGVALGIYGLTQALFQVPFGAASDRWGRKPMIVLGLAIFALGSIVAAESTTIYGVIAGRALQGGGAIAAVVLAFVGDLTRESQRVSAMAIIGMSIGTAFTLALILGPSLSYVAGVRGLFWMAAAMAVVGLFIVWRMAPSAELPQKSGTFGRPLDNLKSILSNLALIRLFAGTMTIHAMMTALFVVFPIELIEATGLARSSTWKVYAPVFVLSFLVMLPLIRMRRQERSMGPVMLIAALLLGFAQLGLIFGAQVDGFMALAIGLWLFFVGFNMLEAMFPATTISTAPVESRGMVMGVFHTCTFFGAFIGGLVGGLVFGAFGSTGVFLVSGVAILAWIVFNWTVTNLEKAQSG